ncbi:MAG: UDP-3-O-(3-hydroxymyristoyl)glucosamine N-acyltransferase, partial [Psychroflexus sp.]
MKFTAKQIAEILEGEIVGNPEAVVSKLSKIEEGEEGSLTFLSNPKYTNFVHSTNASVCIVNKDFNPKEKISVTLIKVEDSYEAFSKLLGYYNDLKNTQKVGLEEPHFIGENTCLGEDIYIGAFVYLGKNVKIGNKVQIHPNSYVGDNVEIGDNTVILPGSKIYADCIIGENCFIHGGVVIGADGFGFTPDDQGVYKKVPQTGNVVIEDHVDVGAGTTIDRATLGSTVIRKGVKLD